MPNKNKNKPILYIGLFFHLITIMAKKCIPGVICIENMTLFFMFLVCLVLIYMYHSLLKEKKEEKSNTNDRMTYTPPILVPPRNAGIAPIAIPAGRADAFNDPYSPPLKMDGLYYATNTVDFHGVPAVPINVQTRGLSTGYSQIGILTRTNSRDNTILPLMGRRLMSGRTKWQYYTMSSTGNINTKLPVSVNGKSCTGEYGCDEISNNDVVYVEGFKDTFIATIYENGMFSYLPF
jgi:hypothetical protein